MLESLKRWLAAPGSHPEWDAAERWARERGFAFKRAREGEGFVIDAADGTLPWRLEWGPSQRDYIEGGELRLRGDLGAAPGLQMLVITRLLMDALERQVFEEFTEGTQTRIDGSTPEEMRWLVLFPKMPGAELKGLREHFGAVANVAQAAANWLDGPLAEALAAAAASWLKPDDRLVLIVQRGRLTLRTAMRQVDDARIDAATTLFDVALKEARRVAKLFDRP
jgi:hypothetical protein